VCGDGSERQPEGAKPCQKVVVKKRKKKNKNKNKNSRMTVRKVLRVKLPNYGFSWALRTPGTR
jgi:hypothetical protein